MAVLLGESRSRYNFSDWFCDFAGVAHLHNVVFGPRAKPQHRGERLAGLEDLSAEQLFFVGLCHPLCTSLDSGQHLAESRCNVPLMHMPQFARAFRCAARSPMAPNTRCSFW
ncbi:neprilysin-1-like [Haemaphysalis longicornis]